MRCAMILIALCVAGLRAQDDLTPVERSGKGPTKSDAVQHCLGQAVGVFLEEAIPDSGSPDRKSRWARQLVIAGAKSLVSYEERKVRSADEDVVHGLWHVTLVVSCSKPKLEKRWAEAQSYVRGIGNPTVAVLVNDLVESRSHPDLSRTFGNASVAKEIEKVLISWGFKVKVPELDEKNRAALIDLMNSDDKMQRAKTMSRLKKQHRTTLFVYGEGRTTGPTRFRDRHEWKSTAKATVCWADSAAAIHMQTEQSSARTRDVESGASKSLQQAGKRLAGKFVQGIFHQWAIDIAQGSTIEVLITECPDELHEVFAEGLEALKEDEGIADVTDLDLDEDTLTFNVQSKISAFKLYTKLRRLVDGKTFALKSKSVKKSRIHLEVLRK